MTLDWLDKKKDELEETLDWLEGVTYPIMVKAYEAADAEWTSQLESDAKTDEKDGTLRTDMDHWL